MVSIEQLPSGKYRAVVRHGGAKRASEAVPTKAEARMLEAKLKLEMGSQPSIREQHSVGEVVAVKVIAWSASSGDQVGRGSGHPTPSECAPIALVNASERPDSSTLPTHQQHSRRTASFASASSNSRRSGDRLWAQVLRLQEELRVLQRACVSEASLRQTADAKSPPLPRAQRRCLERERAHNERRRI